MTISKKIKIILLLLSLSLTMCFMSDTYSRYVADTTGDIEVQFAKWQILVNDNDITAGEKKSLDLQPVVLENEHIAADTFAPSSQGYFDISVDASNVSVSFNYIISLEVLNKDMPDLMITQYSTIDENGVESDKIDIDNTNNVNGLIENAIKKEMLFEKDVEDFKFKPFTIRIYFEWYEGDGEQQDDEADTLIGKNAATAVVETINNDESSEEEITEEENTEEESSEEVEVGKLKIKASITFRQLLKSEINDESTEEVQETKTNEETE